MKTKILALAAVGLIAGAMHADVLYWQVTDTGSDYATAMLSAVNKSTTPETYYYASENTLSGGSAGALINKADVTGGNYAAADLTKILSWDDDTSYSNLSSLSFFIELYDESGNWLRQTTPISYSQLSDYVATTPTFNSNFTGVNGGAFAPTGYAIPEPTSGLLMLVGLGALALRRRKVA